MVKMGPEEQQVAVVSPGVRASQALTGLQDPWGRAELRPLVPLDSLESLAPQEQMVSGVQPVSWEHRGQQVQLELQEQDPLEPLELPVLPGPPEPRAVKVPGECQDHLETLALMECRVRLEHLEREVTQALV